MAFRVFDPYVKQIKFLEISSGRPTYFQQIQWSNPFGWVSNLGSATIMGPCSIWYTRMNNKVGPLSAVLGEYLPHITLRAHLFAKCFYFFRKVETATSTKFARTNQTTSEILVTTFT